MSTARDLFPHLARFVCIGFHGMDATQARSLKLDAEYALNGIDELSAEVARLRVEVARLRELAPGA